MNYHNILHDDILNGDDLGCVLFVSGCGHKCYNCQNPQTHDTDSGVPFDENAKNEIFEQLNHDYIKRLTLSGGDPLHRNNLDELIKLITEVKNKYGDSKKIWIYSGFLYESVLENKKSGKVGEKRFELLSLCDVMVDGRFINKLADIQYQWAGSTNQKVLLVQESLKQDKVVLYDE